MALENAKPEESTMGNKRKELNARLGDYAASARLATAATTLRGRLRNWPVYAAVAGSALAMTTSASAGIISGTYSFTGCTPPSGCLAPIVSAPGNGQSNSSHKIIGFTSAPANLKSEFLHLKAASFGAGNNLSVGLSILGTGGKGIGIFASGYSAKLFHSGSKISAVSNGTGAKIVRKFFASTGGHLGEFVPGQPGFAGLALNTVHGAVDYGWLELQFNNNGQTLLPETLEALAFGIETNPGTPILAGQTVEPTPEPGTMGLALLAAGAAGVVALRRRRRNA